MNYKDRPELTDKWLIYYAAMNDTFDRLLEHHKKIIFVLDTPELGFEPQSCVTSRPVTLTKQTRKICAVSRREHESRFSKYNELMYKIARKYPQITFLNLTDKFCDEEWCYANKNGKYLYRENDHLSDEGSIFIAKFIAPSVLDALK
jgi:hypothetical protein